MKRFFKVLFLVLLGAVLAALAVANREPVRFIIDPLIDRNAAASVAAPLYMLMFCAFFLGLFLGAAVVWIGQRHWRNSARIRSKEAVKWKREAETLKAGLQRQAGGAVSTAAPQPLRSFG